MTVSGHTGRGAESASRPRKALTIGAVCKILQSEFDDVSISKIRYLEDQKLLNPRRTAGGYRLYSRKKDPKSGRRRNLGTFATRAAAEKHERAVQYFKRH